MKSADVRSDPRDRVAQAATREIQWQPPGLAHQLPAAGPRQEATTFAGVPADPAALAIVASESPSGWHGLLRLADVNVVGWVWRYARQGARAVGSMQAMAEWAAGLVGMTPVRVVAAPADQVEPVVFDAQTWTLSMKRSSWTAGVLGLLRGMVSAELEYRLFTEPGEAPLPVAVLLERRVAAAPLSWWSEQQHELWDVLHGPGTHLAAGVTSPVQRFADAVERVARATPDVGAVPFVELLETITVSLPGGDMQARGWYVGADNFRAVDSRTGNYISTFWRPPARDTVSPQAAREWRPSLAAGRTGVEYESSGRVDWPGGSSPLGHEHYTLAQRGDTHLDGDGDFDQVLEGVSSAPATLDDEVVGQEPTTALPEFADLVTQMWELPETTTLTQAFPSFELLSFGDLSVGRTGEPDGYTQHSAGVPIEARYGFIQDVIADANDDPSMFEFQIAVAYAKDAALFGAGFAEVFNGGVPADLSRVDPATTAAGHVTVLYMLTAAMSEHHRATPRYAKNRLLWASRIVLSGMFAALPVEAQLAFEAFAPRVRDDFVADFTVKNAAFVAELAQGRPGGSVDLLHGPLTGRPYTLSEFMDTGLVRAPARTITPMDSFKMRTFWTAPDDNEGHLRHAALDVGELRSFGESISTGWGWVADHQRIRGMVRRWYRWVMDFRSPHGRAKTVLGAAAAELRRLAAAVAGKEGEAAHLLWVVRQAAAELMAGLAVRPDRLDVSVVEATVQLVPAEQRGWVAWAAVQSVYERLDGATRAGVGRVEAAGWAWSPEQVEAVGGWFPKAEVRSAAGVVEAVGWVQASDRFAGAHSAPERVSIVGLEARLVELSAQVGGVGELAGWVGLSGGGEQVVRDAAYLAAAVFGAGFGLGDLVVVGRLMALRVGAGRSAVVTWDDLESLVREVRGTDGHEGDGPVSVGEVRLVVEAARVLEGEVTVAGLRAGAGSALARLAGLATAAGGADALADRVGARRGVGARYGIGVVFGDAVTVAFAVYGDGFTERDLVNAGRLVMAGLRSGRPRLSGWADLAAVVRRLRGDEVGAPGPVDLGDVAVVLGRLGSVPGDLVTLQSLREGLAAVAARVDALVQGAGGAAALAAEVGVDADTSNVAVIELGFLAAPVYGPTFGVDDLATMARLVRVAAADAGARPGWAALESLVRRVRGDDPGAVAPVMVAQVRLLADAVASVDGAVSVDGLRQLAGDGPAWVSDAAGEAGGLAAWLEQLRLPGQLTDRHGSEHMLADIVSLVVAGGLPRTTWLLIGVGGLVSAALREGGRLSRWADAEAVVQRLRGDDPAAPAAAVDPDLVHLLASLVSNLDHALVNMADLRRVLDPVLARVTQLTEPVGGVAALASSLGLTTEDFVDAVSTVFSSFQGDFTEAELVAVQRLWSLRSDGGQWDSLDEAVSQVRGDDPDRPMGRMLAAHQRLLIDAMRELDRADYTAEDLRERVGSSLVRLTRLIQVGGGLEYVFENRTGARAAANTADRDASAVVAAGVSMARRLAGDEFTEGDVTNLITVSSASVRSGRGWVSRWEDLVALVRLVRGDDPAAPVDDPPELDTMLVRLLAGHATEAPSTATIEVLQTRVGRALVRVSDLVRDAGGVSPLAQRVGVRPRPGQSPERALSDVFTTAVSVFGGEFAEADVAALVRLGSVLRRDGRPWELLADLVRDLRGDDPTGQLVPVGAPLLRAVVHLMRDVVVRDVGREVTFADLWRQVAGMEPASGRAARELAQARVDMLSPVVAGDMIRRYHEYAGSLLPELSSRAVGQRLTALRRLAAFLTDVAQLPPVDVMIGVVAAGRAGDFHRTNSPGTKSSVTISESIDEPAVLVAELLVQLIRLEAAGPPDIEVPADLAGPAGLAFGGFQRVQGPDQSPERGPVRPGQVRNAFAELGPLLSPARSGLAGALRLADPAVLRRYHEVAWALPVTWEDPADRQAAVERLVRLLADAAGIHAPTVGPVGVAEGGGPESVMTTLRYPTDLDSGGLAAFVLEWMNQAEAWAVLARVASQRADESAEPNKVLSFAAGTLSAEAGPLAAGDPRLSLAWVLFDEGFHAGMTRIAYARARLDLLGREAGVRGTAAMAYLDGVGGDQALAAIDAIRDDTFVAEAAHRESMTAGVREAYLRPWNLVGDVPAWRHIVVSPLPAPPAGYQVETTEAGLRFYPVAVTPSAVSRQPYGSLRLTVDGNEADLAQAVAWLDGKFDGHAVTAIIDWRPPRQVTPDEWAAAVRLLDDSRRVLAIPKEKLDPPPDPGARALALGGRIDVTVAPFAREYHFTPTDVVGITLPYPLDHPGRWAGEFQLGQGWVVRGAWVGPAMRDGVHQPETVDEAGRPRVVVEGAPGMVIPSAVLTTAVALARYQGIELDVRGPVARPLRPVPLRAASVRARLADLYGPFASVFGLDLPLRFADPATSGEWSQFTPLQLMDAVYQLAAAGAEEVRTTAGMLELVARFARERGISPDEPAPGARLLEAAYVAARAYGLDGLTSARVKAAQLLMAAGDQWAGLWPQVVSLVSAFDTPERAQQWVTDSPHILVALLELARLRSGRPERSTEAVTEPELTEAWAQWLPRPGQHDLSTMLTGLGNIDGGFDYHVALALIHAATTDQRQAVITSTDLRDSLTDLPAGERLAIFAALLEGSLRWQAAPDNDLILFAAHLAGLIDSELIEAFTGRNLRAADWYSMTWSTLGWTANLARYGDRRPRPGQLLFVLSPSSFMPTRVMVSLGGDLAVSLWGRSPHDMRSTQRITVRGLNFEGTIYIGDFVMRERLQLWTGSPQTGPSTEPELAAPTGGPVAARPPRFLEYVDADMLVVEVSVESDGMPLLPNDDGVLNVADRSALADYIARHLPQRWSGLLVEVVSDSVLDEPRRRRFFEVSANIREALTRSARARLLDWLARPDWPSRQAFQLGEPKLSTVHAREQLAVLLYEHGPDDARLPTLQTLRSLLDLAAANQSGLGYSAGEVGEAVGDAYRYLEADGPQARLPVVFSTPASLAHPARWLGVWGMFLTAVAETDPERAAAVVVAAVATGMGEGKSLAQLRAMVGPLVQTLAPQDRISAVHWLQRLADAYPDEISQLPPMLLPVPDPATNRGLQSTVLTSAYVADFLRSLDMAGLSPPSPDARLVSGPVTSSVSLRTRDGVGFQRTTVAQVLHDALFFGAQPAGDGRDVARWADIVTTAQAAAARGLPMVVWTDLQPSLVEQVREVHADTPMRQFVNGMLADAALHRIWLVNIHTVFSSDADMARLGVEFRALLEQGDEAALELARVAAVREAGYRFSGAIVQRPVTRIGRLNRALSVGRKGLAVLDLGGGSLSDAVMVVAAGSEGGRLLLDDLHERLTAPFAQLLVQAGLAASTTAPDTLHQTDQIAGVAPAGGSGALEFQLRSGNHPRALASLIRRLARRFSVLPLHRVDQRSFSLGPASALAHPTPLANPDPPWHTRVEQAAKALLHHFHTWRPGGVYLAAAAPVIQSLPAADQVDAWYATVMAVHTRLGVTHGRDVRWVSAAGLTGLPDGLPALVQTLFPDATVGDVLVGGGVGRVGGCGSGASVRGRGWWCACVVPAE